jgi:hypothetical protein
MNNESLGFGKTFGGFLLGLGETFGGVFGSVFERSAKYVGLCLCSQVLSRVLLFV